MHTACYGKRRQPALGSSIRKLPPVVPDVQPGGVFEGTEYEPAGVRTRVLLAQDKLFRRSSPEHRFSRPSALACPSVRSAGGFA